MDTICTVQFLPHQKSVTVAKGTSVIRAAMAAGVHINASCGGQGSCGRCRIQIASGNVEGGLSDRIELEEINAGFRLACLTKVIEDITVQVPIESEVDAAIFSKASAPRQTAVIKEFDFETLKEKGYFIPPVEKIYLELPPPDSQDRLPDATRLVSHLTVSHNERHVAVDMSVIRKLPALLRTNDFKVTVTLARPVRESAKSRVIHIEGGNTTDINQAIAIDIGTTTVYGQLIDLKSGKVLAEKGRFNSQISYGEDVISRIVFAEKDDGLEVLHQKVINTINEIISKIVESAKTDQNRISTITLAGNTTMTQLFLKVDPSFIRRAPYVPAATLYPPVPATELGLDLGEHVTALVYPAVSSYVGGDIVAGVMGSGMYQDEALTLFMDIGTNAEIVIGNKEWMACAACSAGPALEGGGITFGMRAAKGAIEDFSIDPVTYEPMLLTIGDAKPKGICGSGLIVTAAELFEAGVINNQGKFDRELDTPRIRKHNDVYEYILAWAGETQIDRDIALTEIDLENMIRAKGAIYSGCVTLMEEVGLTIEDLDRIILAGGFGSYIDLEKAMTIGLLPEIDLECVTFMGNSSLLGTRISALTNRIRRDVVRVTRMMTSFELSDTPSYMEHYVAALFLPHTDLKRFPKVMRKLAGRGIE